MDPLGYCIDNGNVDPISHRLQYIHYRYFFAWPWPWPLKRDKVKCKYTNRKATSDFLGWQWTLPCSTCHRLLQRRRIRRWMAFFVLQDSQTGRFISSRFPGVDQRGICPYRHTDTHMHKHTHTLGENNSTLTEKSTRCIPPKRIYSVNLLTSIGQHLAITVLKAWPITSCHMLPLPVAYKGYWPFVVVFIDCWWGSLQALYSVVAAKGWAAT